MEVTDLLSDDDAVSPVISVILMVAITVILAAVIATFVLGLGDSVSSEAPQVQFEFDSGKDAYADASGGDDDGIEITHNGGDELTRSNLQITVDGAEALNEDGTINSGGTNFVDAGSGTGASEPSDPVTAGDGYILVEDGGSNEGLIEDGDPVRVIWENPDSDNTAIIGESEVDF